MGGDRRAASNRVDMAWTAAGSSWLAVSPGVCMPSSSGEVAGMVRRRMRGPWVVKFAVFVANTRIL